MPQHNATRHKRLRATETHQFAARTFDRKVSVLSLKREPLRFTEPVRSERGMVETRTVDQELHQTHARASEKGGKRVDSNQPCSAHPAQFATLIHRVYAFDGMPDPY